MRKHGHYCKICGEYKVNEEFSGKGHIAHICKSCAKLPAEEQAEQMTLTRLSNLPAYLSKAKIAWLKKKCDDRRENVRELANSVYDLHFPPGH